MYVSNTSNTYQCYRNNFRHPQVCARCIVMIVNESTIMSADNQTTLMPTDFVLKIPDESKSDSLSRKTNQQLIASLIEENSNISNNGENSDSLHSCGFVNDDKKQQNILKRVLPNVSKMSRRIMSKKRSPLLNLKSKQNMDKTMLTKIKKLEDRIEMLENNSSCCCGEDSNDTFYKLEDLELLVNDTTEKTKEELQKVNNRYQLNENNHEELRKNLEIVEEHISQVFESTNNNGNEVKQLSNMTQTKLKINETQIATNRGFLNDFKYIVESTLNLLDEKSTDDVDIKLAQAEETLYLRKALVNMLFMISTIIQDLDDNVCLKVNELDKIMIELSKESNEFEQIFYNNFSSLSHGLGAKADSPGHILASTRGVKNGQIKLTFDAKTIELPYTSSSEICARILTVHGEKNSFSKTFLKKLWPKQTEVEEKVILLVGVTGAGKSTLIDAITNFYYNIRYDDPFRLALIDLLDAEKRKQGNQANSQTDEITIYKLPYLENGNSKGFKLTIIDTPGVGDTRGINQDKKIIEKLGYLFENGNVSVLNSVCFVSKAGDARLTAGQKYIFDSLITNFGVDLVNNIMGLFTFDDGGPAKATDAFKEARIGLTAHFKFNSQAMLHERVYQTPVNKTIMMTMEAQDCVQFQHFYNNCDDFFGTLVR